MAKQRIVAKVTSHALASGPLTERRPMLQEDGAASDGNVLLTYLDVTDTSRVERALRERNEALVTAGRLKSEFIANVSHELRTR
jgi:signal transduction histidine kinase